MCFRCAAITSPRSDVSASAEEAAATCARAGCKACRAAHSRHMPHLLAWQAHVHHMARQRSSAHHAKSVPHAGCMR